MLCQQADHRHHEPGRAEAALEAVTFVERLLHRMQRRPQNGQALDGRHFVAFGLNREHQARPHRRSVEQHSAAAADPMLAANVRAGQTEVVSKMVREQATRIALGRVDETVDLHAANALSVRVRTR